MVIMMTYESFNEESSLQTKQICICRINKQTKGKRNDIYVENEILADVKDNKT